MADRVKVAAFLVATHIEGEEHLGGELSALFEHGVDGVHIHIGMRGHGLEFIDNVQQLVHHKLHIAQGRGVAGHGDNSCNKSKTVNESDLAVRGQAAAWPPAPGAALRAKMLSNPRLARASDSGFCKKRAS